jgi:hypothetical protein
MRIGLISDSHNDKGRLRRALDRFRAEGITTVLHAGDVTNASTLRMLASFDVWVARGNMDHDPGLVREAYRLFGKGRMRKVHELSLDGAAVAMVHDEMSDTWRDLVASEAYDYVISGHTHRRRDERFGETRAINPGALNNNRGHGSTFAILDLNTDDLTLIEL